jgi:hypothetical protein
MLLRKAFQPTMMALIHTIRHRGGMTVNVSVWTPAYCA